MKVLFFSKAKRTTQATEHMMTALRRHPEVRAARHVNYRKLERLAGVGLADRLIRGTIRRFRPDLTLINNMDIRIDWLELCRTYGVTQCVFHEHGRELPALLLDIGRRVDMLYVASEKQIPELEAEGVSPVRMLHRGCSRDNHYPFDGAVGARWRSDVAFIGKPRAGVREKILEAVGARYHLALWGPGWDDAGFGRGKRRVAAREYRKICAGAAIMLGINDGCAATMEEAVSLTKYTSNRTRVTLACGGFLLTNYNHGLEEIFTPGVHLDFYASIEECLTKIDHYLARPEERARIARQGSEYVRAHMTFDHFVDAVIKDARALRAR